MSEQLNGWRSCHALPGTLLASYEPNYPAFKRTDGTSFRYQSCGQQSLLWMRNLLFFYTPDISRDSDLGPGLLLNLELRVLPGQRDEAAGASSKKRQSRRSARNK